MLNYKIVLYSISDIAYYLLSDCIKLDDSFSRYSGMEMYILVQPFCESTVRDIGKQFKLQTCRNLIPDYGLCGSIVGL